MHGWDLLSLFAQTVSIRVGSGPFEPPNTSMNVNGAASVVSQKKSCTRLVDGYLRGMPRKRHNKPMVLTEDERRTLEQWTRRPTTAQRLALRSRMVLACAEGLTNRAVAKRLGVSSNSVCKWRERFRARRLPGLTDEPRPG